MAYVLRYHPSVAADDLPKLPAQTRDRIARQIEARLAASPERYGAPLSGSLRGYWKLRVGDYRIVFTIGKGEEWILAVLHRKDVYGRAARRRL